MKEQRSSWRLLIGIVGFVLLVSACEGSSGGPTGATSSTPTATSTPAPATNASSPTKSTVTFTASGGLTGTYTISDNDRGSNYGKALTILVGDQNWNFSLSYSAYTGPKSYTFKFDASNPPWGSLVLASKDGTKRWSLTPATSCQMTVTSDTTLAAGGGPGHHEVKGSFSCPSLAPISTSAAPLVITNGQFDIVALVFAP